ncbi:MAG: pyruvate synthase subunit PorB [Thermoplasmata archaeon]|nr:pyruvate synthase subunit PorB [Thermoplasmata archaeon]
MNEESLFASGHTACAGCGATIALRLLLAAAGKNTIVCQVTGCMEVVSTGYPNTAWKVPYIHVAFENAAAVASGVDAALKAKGEREGKNIIALGGDGGTYDIGLQALSGMLERGHDVLYVCYDNEAYMNTGIQRSSATPYGASTTTSPPGKFSIGEDTPKKPLAEIVAAHRPSYVATASVGYYQDFQTKVKKALSKKGPSFILVYTPCPTGWRTPSEKTMEIAKLAVDTGYLILWEMENGDRNTLKVTKMPPKPRKPVEEYLKIQGRFRHLMNKPEELKKIQELVDAECKRYGIE